MPELPEVQTIANSLAPFAVDAAISNVRVLRFDYVRPAMTDLYALLVGRTIGQVHRRGKRLIFCLKGGGQFLFHLGMSGRVTIQPPGTDPAKHTHLILTVQHDKLRREIHLNDARRFGKVEWLGDLPCDHGLGVDALVLTPATLRKVLRASRRPIKSLLLDQTKVAGLGNIYVDESLFAAGIHPLAPANQIPPEAAGRLTRSIKLVLRRALRHRGSTLRDYVDADGTTGSFQRLHRVYGREGQKCRKCRATVQRIVLGGRSTCFCPNCQVLHAK